MLRIFLFLSLLLHVNSQAIVNPVKTPVKESSLRVFTRKFAQLPKFRGNAQRIVSMTSCGPNLFVINNINGHIYKITPSGSVSLWFNVADAVLKQTGRQMDFTVFLHSGLRGLAFHPQFKRNGLFYTAHMETRGNTTFRYLSDTKDPIDADSVIAEWRVNRETKVPIPSSYRQILRIGMPVYDHTVREIRFSGDYLYIGHGDGSQQSRTAGGGQRNDGLGKVLRINPLKSGSRAYTVPSSNPFIGNSRYLDEIYALGFRNPHNLCFSKRKELFVVDVGRDNIEEINIIKPNQGGGDYGWSQREGPFKHLEGDGGILTGIAPLPKDDQKFGFIYPNAIVGHFGERGAGFVFQALTGSCPIENGSKLDGLMLYANFPDTGKLYYSKLDDMRNAVVTGPPDKLSQATTYAPQLFYDHDGNPETPPIKVENFREIVRMDPEFKEVKRVDCRFGQGNRGEIYWGSKQNGAVYLITNSIK